MVSKSCPKTDWCQIRLRVTRRSNKSHCMNSGVILATVFVICYSDNLFPYTILTAPPCYYYLCSVLWRLCILGWIFSHNKMLKTTATCSSLETEWKLKTPKKTTDTRTFSEDPGYCLGAADTSTELWNEKKAEEKIENKQKETIIAQSPYAWLDFQTEIPTWLISTA